MELVNYIEGCSKCKCKICNNVHRNDDCVEYCKEYCRGEHLATQCFREAELYLLDSVSKSFLFRNMN